MAVNREELKRLIDLVPEDKLNKLRDLLDEWAGDTLTEKELKEIKEAENRIAKGEFDTLEDLYDKYRSDL